MGFLLDIVRFLRIYGFDEKIMFEWEQFII